MTQNLETIRVKRILLIQIVLSILIPLAILPIKPEAFWSALAGGLISSLAAGFFAFWIYGRYRAEQPGQLMMRFYGGEALKLLLTGLLFAAVFIWLRPLHPVALFVTFLIVQILSPVLAQRLN